MKHGFFATVFYIPLYNALIALLSVVPGANAGYAVILLTLIVRVILYPLSKKSIVTNLEMRRIDPEIKKLQAEVKDKQEQARKLMALYKTHNINPFAGFFLLIIQLPILIAIYQVFQSGLPKIDTTILYSFVHAPANVTMSLFGIDLLAHSVILALLVVITQFIQINIALPKVEKKKEGGNFQSDLAYNMNMQMRYILPLVIFPIAYFSAVIALYLLTTNIFSIFQELFVKRKLEQQYAARAPKA